MTLPTVQPVDWPDWGVMPTTTTRFFNVPAIAAPSAVILEASVGYFSYAVLNVSADGDGESSQFAIEWYDAAQSEGPNLVGSVDVVRIWPVAVVIPMAVWTPYLVLRELDATTYPHNMIGTLTLASQVPYQTGYPGGTRVMATQQIVAGGATDLFTPSGCAPGEHCVQVITDATDWDLNMVNYVSPSVDVGSLLADETTVAPYDIRFIGPASSWQLSFTNHDAGSCNVTIFVNRYP